MNIFKRVRKAVTRQQSMLSRLDKIQESLGRIESRQQTALVGKNPRYFEFKVYSQWGEDGIIDHLVCNVSISENSFVEFGVENYTEANTLFLLKHRNWRGLVIDGSSTNVEAIRKSDTYWQYDLHADASFITKDNINEIISRNGFSGDIGLLSVDIDGNDYWVWDAISCINPRIVVSEYNSLFGPSAAITTPYSSDFFRTVAHPSNMYYGASISALNHLAERRGYSLVAGNSVGNNVFFVRNDCLGSLKRQSPQDAYVQAGFREARARDDGHIDGLHFAARQSIIKHLPVIDVTTGLQLTLETAL
jgi:hypothetical protein